MLKQQILELEKRLDEKAEEVFDLLNEGIVQKHKRPHMDTKTEENQSMRLEIAKQC